MEALPTARKKNKYCQFHHDYSHNTEKCIQLKDNIEAFIRWGYLEKCIHEGAQPNTQNLD